MQDVQEAPATIDPEALLAFASSLRSGDFSARLPAEGDSTAADAARQLNYFAQHMQGAIAQLTRLSNELRQGIFGGVAESVVYIRPSPWRECLEAFNEMEWALTGQIRNFAKIASRLAAGKTDCAVTVDCQGETLQLKNALNAIADLLKAAK